MDERTAIPDIPFKFTELEAMSTSELQRLATDKTACRDFVMSLEAVKGFRGVMLDSKRNNLNTARSTLAKEAELESLQTEVDVLRVAARTAQEEHADLSRRHSAFMGRYAPAGLQRQLEDKAQTMEGETDSMVQGFIDSGSADGFKRFLHDFREQRKVYHRYASKSEMLRLAPPSM